MAKISFFTLLINLSALTALSAQAADLPPTQQEVHLRNKFESFAAENDYYLKEGKLWIKPRGAQASAWQLFLGTGVPSGPLIHSFGAQDHLVAFDQEGTMVFALSDKGRIYRWYPPANGNVIWEEIMGTPWKGPLYLPPHRDWAFSLSTSSINREGGAPVSREIVETWEDGAGNPFRFGITATIYSLNPSGQKITLWDTGLPDSWHRGLLTPEHGRFVAQRLAASASTLFVIDSVGRMFTRLADYETFVGTPGLRSTYRPGARACDPKNPIRFTSVTGLCLFPIGALTPPFPCKGRRSSRRISRLSSRATVTPPASSGCRGGTPLGATAITQNRFSATLGFSTRPARLLPKAMSFGITVRPRSADGC